jgi:hypothetical protein
MGFRPDIAPYHDRQTVILERDAWADWLDPTVSAKSLIESCRSTRFRPNKSAELQPGWLRSTFFFALCWADHALSGGQFEQHAL